MPLFDTHAHYDDSRFDADRGALLSFLPEAGVELVLNPGCDLPSSRTAVELAERFRHVYAAVGFHPENCASCCEADLGELRRLAAHPKVKAIGEIGLDYYWKENPPREFQQTVFRRQMELAQELELPVIVHDREAHADSLAIAEEYPAVRGVFHCYSGSVEQARRLLELGWMISFTGVLTYRNARKAAEVAQYLPLDRIMLETDCPYMTPEPHRKRRNDSRYLLLTAERLAELKGLPVRDVIRITCENGKRFFNIQSDPEPDFPETEDEVE